MMLRVLTLVTTGHYHNNDQLGQVLQPQEKFPTSSSLSHQVDAEVAVPQRARVLRKAKNALAGPCSTVLSVKSLCLSMLLSDRKFHVSYSIRFFYI